MSPLIPRDLRFYDLFERQAKHAHSAASLLHELFQDLSRLDATAAEIKRVEHEADSTTEEIVTRLTTSFVTPLDREDILLLATRLDNIVDRIDEAARRATEFRIEAAPEEATHMTSLLTEATAQIANAVAGMRRAQTMEEPNRRVKELEEQGDAVYHAAVGSLFSGAPNPLEVIKWKELFDVVEGALDCCDEVSNVLKTISLKHG